MAQEGDHQKLEHRVRNTSRQRKARRLNPPAGRKHAR